MSIGANAGRINSLDQFRGYSVAAMFVVNFLGGLAITHQVLKHNNTHFSYADSIMPSFLFACGFSYHMSFLKRLTELGRSAARMRFLSRSLGLILLSLMLTGFNSKFDKWSSMTPQTVATFVAELFKANLWEVLAIIGALQIIILPIVASGALVRSLAIVLCALVHVWISWSFNYEFVYGRPSWMDAYFGAVGKRAWDGGFFGLISWAEVMLAGTLAYDIINKHRSAGAAVRLLAWGSLLMLIGYSLSCMTRLYDVAGTSGETASPTATSPVMPPIEKAAGRKWTTLLAEPPFVAPPPPNQRQLNYWMMDKRVVTQAFMFFSTGFACALFGLFVIACDIWSIESGLFKTFGQNPLAAYIVHHFVANAVLNLVPKDAPMSLTIAGLAFFFTITYCFVRFLENRGLYLRM